MGQGPRARRGALLPSSGPCPLNHPHPQLSQPPLCGGRGPVQEGDRVCRRPRPGFHRRGPGLGPLTLPAKVPRPNPVPVSIRSITAPVSKRESRATHLCLRCPEGAGGVRSGMTLRGGPGHTREAHVPDDPLHSTLARACASRDTIEDGSGGWCEDTAVERQAGRVLERARGVMGLASIAAGTFRHSDESDTGRVGPMRSHARKRVEGRALRQVGNYCIKMGSRTGKQMAEQ